MSVVIFWGKIQMTLKNQVKNLRLRYSRWLTNQGYRLKETCLSWMRSWEKWIITYKWREKIDFKLSHWSHFMQRSIYLKKQLLANWNLPTKPILSRYKRTLVWLTKYPPKIAWSTKKIHQCFLFIRTRSVRSPSKTHTYIYYFSAKKAFLWTYR